jgi:hypothetical protein
MNHSNMSYHLHGNVMNSSCLYQELHCNINYYTEATKKVTILQAFLSLPTAVFPTDPLWPETVQSTWNRWNVITAKTTHGSTTATWLHGNLGQYAEDKGVTVWGRCEGGWSMRLLSAVSVQHLIQPKNINISNNTWKHNTACLLWPTQLLNGLMKCLLKCNGKLEGHVFDSFNCTGNSVPPALTFNNCILSKSVFMEFIQLLK